jgi:hypothetical protein
MFVESQRGLLTLPKIELGGQQINHKQSIFCKESLSNHQKSKRDNPIKQYYQEPPISHRR